MTIDLRPSAEEKRCRSVLSSPTTVAGQRCTVSVCVCVPVPVVQSLLLAAARDARKSPFSQILLERRNRVTSPSEFKSIIRTGGKVVCPHFVCYRVEANEAKFGIVVSKKNGNAVIRNRIRRRARAAARHLIDTQVTENKPVGGFFVLRFRPEASEPSFAEIRDELRLAMNEYQKRSS